MDKEVLEMYMKMDMDAPEVQMALQCAPVFAGAKISNLLIMREYELPSAMVLLRGLGVCFYVLGQKAERKTLLVYNGRKLVERLQRTDVKHLLEGYGYISVRLGWALPRLASRYEACLERRGGFPHELGLFLGYPVEDVAGFLRNGGRNYLCAGYWKVYGGMIDKERLFSYYDAVTYQFLSVLSDGGTLRQCIRAERADGEDWDSPKT